MRHVYDKPSVLRKTKPNDDTQMCQLRKRKTARGQVGCRRRFHIYTVYVIVNVYPRRRHMSRTSKTY